jgi:hypothetical protein
VRATLCYEGEADKMNDEKKEPTAYQSTPHSDLISELMDSRVPKNEREWAAAREIDELRAENKILASLLECWLDPTLQGDNRWAISAETLEQLVAATKGALEARRR